MWKDISGKISARGEFGGAAVITPMNDIFCGKKTIIPDGTLMFIPVQSKDEAHYLAAILNSMVVRFVAKAYSVLHVRGHIVNYVGIRNFDPSNDVHKRLVELSKKAHEFASVNSVAQLASIEEKIDETVAKIYSLDQKELRQIEKSHSILES